MKNLVFAGLISIIMFNSCMEDSSLSDVEITDPSLIEPDINLIRERDNSGRLKSSIIVYLWDKNFDAIELKKGNVSVNGHTMQVEKLVLTGGPYYTIDTSILKVELDELYTFTIELADGQKYEASITTQDIDLYELNLPADYSKLNNMDIIWKGYDIENEFQIQLTCDYRTSTSSGQTSNTLIPDQNERISGSYIISKSYFNQKEGIYKATVRITSKTNGTIDPGFRDNSKIYSYFIKESECNVN